MGALRRHDDDDNVVFKTCHAIHYLTMTENNVSWMGANGGCEAITKALIKHTGGLFRAYVGACIRFD